MKLLLCLAFAGMLALAYATVYTSPVSYNNGWGWGGRSYGGYGNYGGYGGYGLSSGYYGSPYYSSYGRSVYSPVHSYGLGYGYGGYGNYGGYGRSLWY